jgi:hypothetical protein
VGGATGLTVIHFTSDLFGAGWNFHLHCPAPKIAINGMAEVLTTTMHLEGSMNEGSRDTGTPSGDWEMDFTIDDDATVDVGVVCVNPPVGNSAPTAGGASARATYWAVPRR